MPRHPVVSTEVRVMSPRCRISSRDARLPDKTESCLRRGATIGMLLLVVACTRASPPADGRANATAVTGARAEDGEPRGKLMLALPAWVSVSVDGEPHKPDRLVEVSTGPHELALRSVCGVLAHHVEVSAGVTTRVSAEDVRGLRQASLQLDVRARDGKELVAMVRLDDDYGKPSAEGEGWQAVVPGDGKLLEVPACRLRMTVRTMSEARLGAFIEDVELTALEPLRRRIVLLPGSDLVRIRGGSFVAGQTPGYLEGDSGRWMNVVHDVPTFDIDRHEVTADQYDLCVNAGGCALDFRLFRRTQRPPKKHIDRCNIQIFRGPREKLIYRGRFSGFDYPANCIPMWEAARYCAWAGKRLPTTVEWEFAARSRKTQYKWPWGNDESKCRAHTRSRSHEPPVCPERDETAKVCSYPEGNSEQGVCDFVGNVQELMEYPAGHPAKAGASVRGGSYERAAEPFQDVRFRSVEKIDEERYRQEAAVGFRCARDIEGETE